MTPDPNWEPSVYKQRLRRLLREARDRAALKQTEVAEQLQWSPSKVIRIEAGTTDRVSHTDLKALVELYEISGQEANAILETGKHARARSPLQEFKPYITPEFNSYLGYEASASVIRNFETILVPGLLQTEEYAANILHHIRGPHNEKRIKALVKLRLLRQSRLLHEGSVKLRFMLDESILHRPVGGPDVMRGQLEHMREIAQRLNVVLYVVPFSLGVYRSVRVPYVLLDLTDRDHPPVLFLEYPEKDVIIVGNIGDSPTGVDVGAASDDEGQEPISPATYLEIYYQLEAECDQELSIQLIDDSIARLT